MQIKYEIIPLMYNQLPNHNVHLFIRFKKEKEKHDYNILIWKVMVFTNTILNFFIFFICVLCYKLSQLGETFNKHKDWSKKIEHQKIYNTPLNTPSILKYKGLCIFSQVPIKVSSKSNMFLNKKNAYSLNLYRSVFKLDLENIINKGKTFPYF